ncbi:hypothetical protein GCM10023169_14460 [Georgenia halophila]|uniref:Glycosyltransferase n=1 Tax=Georgenia halophila TaxID=620889 RepID=A0ABP8L4J6_9MICO
MLVVTLDTVGERMAGPAIRAWEMARALSRTCDVLLATFGGCSRDGEGFATRAIRPAQFRDAVEVADVIVLQGYVMAAFPWLRRSDKVVVVDLYDPFHLESLEVARHETPGARRLALRTALTELNEQVRRGDVFLCASEKQRDFWLGHLAAVGRLNPETYEADATMRDLVKIVPFGLGAAPPEPGPDPFRGRVPGIEPGDPVVLWGGGVYNWFDPLTLVRAVDRVRERVPNVRLYFLGMRHPNPDVPEMAMANACRELAGSLGLIGTHVFFNTDWVPYETRADYLDAADVGVSCHLPQVETQYSFRTRILDYLWAGLPIVCTDGDTFGDLVQAEGLGVAVPAQDVEALARALCDLILDRDRREAAAARSRAVAQRYTWDRALAPLVEFCESPRRASDAGADYGTPVTGLRGAADAVRAVATGAVRHWREGGPRQLGRRVAWRARQLTSR